ncbi:MAG: hypothetical protein EOP83_04035 [Verrucomicrobiaceae bacterium]|nr:MAG: hypothetical protein EOP83_04035 [Verrucomicrobiaceae bacterium]
MAYLGWELSEAERARLLTLFPPAYPDVVAHHVTKQFGVSEDTPAPDQARFAVVGVTDDGEKLQTLVVSVDGQTQRPDGETYHVTWSLDREAGAKPKDSKMAIKRLGYTVTDRVEFQAEPKTFT